MIMMFNIGSSVLTDVLLWWGMLTMGEAMHVLEQGIYGKLLYQFSIWL